MPEVKIEILPTLADEIATAYVEFKSKDNKDAPEKATLVSGGENATKTYHIDGPEDQITITAELRGRVVLDRDQNAAIVKPLDESDSTAHIFPAVPGDPARVPEGAPSAVADANNPQVDPRTGAAKAGSSTFPAKGGARSSKDVKDEGALKGGSKPAA